MASTDVWYANGIYSRYWKHYQYTMGWMRQHRTAYWKAKAKADEYENRALLHYLQWLQAANYTSNDHQSLQLNYYQTNQVADQWYDESASTCSMSQSNEINNNDDVQFEMEITEEMLAFLDKSDQHRKELKEKREAEERQEMMDRQSTYECTAPKEQKGAKRTAEIKLLYGKHASRIHGMETAMQMMYNMNCDRFQPKYWPNIPLNL